jgi:hypothetical protein
VLPGWQWFLAHTGSKPVITRGRRPPLTGLNTRLLTERDTIRSVLGKN